MGQTFITTSNTTQEILDFCAQYAPNCSSDNSSDTCCNIVKSLFNYEFNGKNGATISERVYNTFQTVLTHCQRAYKEVKFDTNALIDEDIAQIGCGLFITSFGLYESYHCIKNFFKGEKTKAYVYGGLAVPALMSGGYLIYNGIVKISLSPFCKV